MSTAVALIGWVLGKNGSVEYFLLKADLNYKAIFYC